MEDTKGSGPAEQALRKIGAQIDRLLANPDDIVSRIEKELQDLKPQLDEMKVRASLGKMEIRDRLLPLLDAIQAMVNEIRARIDAVEDIAGTEGLDEAVQAQLSDPAQELMAEEELR